MFEMQIFDYQMDATADIIHRMILSWLFTSVNSCVFFSLYTHTHNTHTHTLTHTRILCRTIENGLKYKYYSVWYLVLGVLETFYTIAGESCYKFMTKVCTIITVEKILHDNYTHAIIVLFACLFDYYLFLLRNNIIILAFTSKYANIQSNHHYLQHGN